MGAAVWGMVGHMGLSMGQPYLCVPRPQTTKMLLNVTTMGHQK